MKTVDISNIVEGSRRLGATGVTLLHLAEAIKETVGNVVKGIAVDPNGVTVLYGCVNSGIGSNFIISAGAVYYNGEVYDVDAFTGTASGGQTAVISIVTTYRAGDPVLYSNGQKYPTHAIRKMQWSISTIGSGVSDYSGVLRLKDRVNTNLLDIPTQLTSALTSAISSAVATANAYTDAQVVGLWNDRGNYNPAGGAYPSTGGSGTAGAIKKGDIWISSGNGTLPTGQVVEPGDTIRALIDAPGNTQANWAIGQNNIGYIPLNKAGDTMSGVLDMGANKVTNLPTATNPSDAVRFDQIQTTYSLSTDRIIKWNGTQFIDSLVQDDGVLVTINGKLNVLTQNSWITIPLINGWTNFIGTLKYRIDSLGRVHLSGHINAAGSTSSNFANIPTAISSFTSIVNSMQFEQRLGDGTGSYGLSISSIGISIIVTDYNTSKRYRIHGLSFWSDENS